MTHWFLSPHFDDAAYSCGGQISQLTQNGEQVVIFTLMAATPPARTIADVIQAEKWEQAGAYVLTRREEDKAAAARLGASLEFGSYYDAIYRLHPQTGRLLYNDGAAIFGVLQPADPLNQSDVMPDIPLAVGDTLHAPLGVGRHADHRLVSRMALRLAAKFTDISLYFYEEFPYSRQGEIAVQDAIALLGVPLEQVVHPLDETAIAARVAASLCYGSQIKGSTLETFADELRESIHAAGGEREWRYVAPIEP